MIKTPLSTVIGGAFWTPGCTVIGSASKTLDQLIKSLFSLGEQGFAYDPNDLTTMWQDQAKLLPVTGAGQPVWHILDKSGNNNHAFATSSATRPVLQRNATTGAYYLEFDGADDFLQTSSTDLTAADKVSLFAGINNLSSSTATKIIVELSVESALTNGAFAIMHGYSAVQDYAVRSHGTTRLEIRYNKPAPDLCVMGIKASISAPILEMRRNGSIVASSMASQGDGNYGNYPLYIGRRAGTSLPFSGHLYSLIGIGRLTTDSETIALEKAIAKNTGVTLNV